MTGGEVGGTTETLGSMKTEKDWREGPISRTAAEAGPKREGAQEGADGTETEAQHTASSLKKFAEKKGKFRGEIFSGMWEKEKVRSESGESDHNQAEREERKQRLKGGRGKRLGKQR